MAEVRKAREKLLAAAGYDLEELCRRLNEQQQREGRGTVTRPARLSKRERVKTCPEAEQGHAPAARERRAPVIPGRWVAKPSVGLGIGRLV